MEGIELKKKQHFKRSKRRFNKFQNNKGLNFTVPAKTKKKNSLIKTKKKNSLSLKNRRSYFMGLEPSANQLRKMDYHNMYGRDFSAMEVERQRGDRLLLREDKKADLKHMRIKQEARISENDELVERRFKKMAEMKFKLNGLNRKISDLENYYQSIKLEIREKEIKFKCAMLDNINNLYRTYGESFSVWNKTSYSDLVARRKKLQAERKKFVAEKTKEYKEFRQEKQALLKKIRIDRQELIWKKRKLIDELRPRQANYWFARDKGNYLRKQLRRLTASSEGLTTTSSRFRDFTY